MAGEDNVTVGLTEESRAILRRLQEEEIFADMLDGFRLSLALAVSREIAPREDLKSSTTAYNFGTLDPDGGIRSALSELYPDRENLAALAQGLAEAGIAEIGRMRAEGRVKFGALLKGSIAAGQTEAFASSAS
jgi:hypothetical protein